MLRLLKFFGGKNSSPIISKLVRARASNPFILLVGTIKACNLYYQHFLLRPFLSEIFPVPFHRAKMIEQGETVVSWSGLLKKMFNVIQIHIFQSVFSDRPSSYGSVLYLLSGSVFISFLIRKCVQASRKTVQEPQRT